MKKSVLCSLLCVVFTAASFAGNTNDAPVSGFSIIQNGSVVNVLYKSIASQNVKVSIFDSRNNLVYTEVLKHRDGFSRPYNMKGLPEGIYAVEVEDEFGSSKKIVRIGAAKNAPAFHLERVHGTERKLLLTVGKWSKGFEILIEDKYGNDLYSDNKILHGDFATVYNISKVKGAVSIVITDFHGNKAKFDF
jgi:hypothetical protein